MAVASHTTRQRIDELNKEAWAIRVHDSEKAFASSKKIIALAKKNKYKKGIAYATLTHTFCLIRLSKYKEALPQCKECLSLFKELQEQKGIADTYEQFAVIYRFWGKMSLALEYLVKALTIADKHGLLECRTTHHYQLGVVCKQLGDFDKALDHLYTTITLARELGHLLYEAYATNVIGLIFFETGDHKKALEHFLKALAIRRKAGDKWGVAGSLGYIGLAYYKLKKYKQAITYCRQSIAITRKTGDKRGQANSLFHLAEIYEETGDLRGSLACSNESLHLRKSSGDKRAEAEVMLFQAGLSGDRGKQTEKLLQEVAKLARRLKATDLLSKARKKLYEYYKETGDHSKAIIELETHILLEAELHKNSVNQKISNLEITHEAEEAQKAAETTRLKNEELTKLNKELEVESSLERVRAVAMGMKSREDMLDICKIIAAQLALLGVKEIRNVQTAIFYYDKGFYVNYQYYAKHDKTFITDTVYTDHKVPRAFAAKMQKGKGQFSVTHIRGRQELKKWVAYQKGTNVFLDTYLHTADYLGYYWFSLGPVAMGISTYQQLTSEDMELFKRFRNVFDLAYRRYLDIEKAEAQAKEARIEAALEKVRAQAMGMHRPDDILNVCKTIFKELPGLGFREIRNTLINFWDDKNRELIDYDYSDLTGGNIGRLEYSSHPVFEKFQKTIRRSKDAFAQLVVKKDQLASWRKRRKDSGEYEDPRLKRIDALYYYFYSIEVGAVGISAFRPLSPENLELLKRFRNVFNLAYRRYQDIEKAEAQAKEAQIEAALERVRARAMGMQKSEELSDVVGLLYKQFQELDFGFYQILISIVDTINNGVEWWSRGFNETAPPQRYFIPLIDHPFPNMQRKKWASGTAYYAHVLEGENKKSWEEYLFTRTDLRHLPKPVQKQMRSLDKVYLSDAFMKHGILQAGGPAPLPDDKVEVLKRFAKVLDQAYTRMKDLQNAEAQAREAQIEAALERVRSRTMAMHQTSELQEVIHTVHTELLKLSLSIDGGSFVVINEDVGPGLRCWGSGGTADTSEEVQVPHFNMPFVKNLVRGIKKGAGFFTEEFSQREKRSFFTKLFAQEPWSKLPAVQKKKTLSEEGGYTRSVAVSKHTSIFIINHLGKRFSDADNDILQRFANVFEQTYTRFLDLRRAEAQAREAQIEAALERVRSRTMAMHQSLELNNTAELLYQELSKLGIEKMTCGFTLLDARTGIGTCYMANPQGNFEWEPFRLDHSGSPGFLSILESWKKKQPFKLLEFSGKQNKDHNRYLATHADNFPLSAGQLLSILPPTTYSNSFNFRYGYLLVVSLSPFAAEQTNIISRFAKVFEQTYTRFLDLQKAEAQAREAQIETALERVRSRSMAMHSSGELEQVIKVLTDQLTVLGFHFDTANFVTHEHMPDWEIWISSPGLDFIPPRIHVPYLDHPLFNERTKYLQEGKEMITAVLDKATKNRFFRHMFSKTAAAVTPEERKKWIYDQKGMAITTVLMKAVSLSVLNYDAIPYSEEENNVIRRMGKAFEQSFTRFLDLQKAEAQARESQIQLALERVRARTMAMQRSDELMETAVVLFTQLNQLGENIERTIIGVINEEEQVIDFWATRPDGSQMDKMQKFPMNEPIVAQKVVQAWQQQKRSIVIDLQHEELDSYFQFLKSRSSRMTRESLGNRRVENFAFFSKGFLGIINADPNKPADTGLYERFAAVFDQTYTRFLDLQKAEAQAREAQIEASLERVRAKAMAMHNSQDVSVATATMFNELNRVGVESMRCGVAILQKESSLMDVWAATVTKDGHAIKGGGLVDTNKHPLWIKMHQDWIAGEESFSYHMMGDVLRSYYKALAEMPNYSAPYLNDDPPEHYCYVTYFDDGVIFTFNQQVYSGDQRQILKRFASVFSLTYKRYKDLEKAETQAREALIEVALERVRARALAMQEPEELKTVAAVMRNEMGALGVEELETASIYIHGDSSTEVECWYALQDPKETQKKMIADHFMLDLNETWVGREMKKFYLSGEKQISVVMQGANRREWIEYCYRNSPVFSGFYGETIPDRTYHLYKFSHGYIGAAAPGEISAESWKLLSRAASVFSLAYSRFKDLTQARNDLKQLKEEKQRAESALGELQLTQKQLIQSEKMASLGELTAGIAHEIQNPLNFVNNFSEVSTELIQELKEELAKGNTEIVNEIAEDLVQNLEKINHHGKRADGIVKGMLQHSRSGSGQKEATDINALCDEYLRLAYHGLRAKDKSFNAKFEAKLDPGLPKINVMPQDIGRVVLNLINNAFYAVSEQKKNEKTGYEPTVTVTTKLENHRVIISVADNGTGMPQQVVDKIFQPFFTTKPTGQGTGLGLSLSYDIVKAHGGELKVETKEGRGTTFIIDLPNQSA